MDAKLKAGKLISRFVVLGFTLCSSRECALVVVDEIIKELYPADVKRCEYWQEVKKEIENL